MSQGIYNQIFFFFLSNQVLWERKYFFLSYQVKFPGLVNLDAIQAWTFSNCTVLSEVFNLSLTLFHINMRVINPSTSEAILRLLLDYAGKAFSTVLALELNHCQPYGYHYYVTSTHLSYQCDALKYILDASIF